MRKFVWVTLILLVLAGLVAFYIYRTRQVKITTDAAKVYRDIRDHLPIGSSRADVAAYLDQRGIPHSYVADSKEVPEYAHMEMAMIRAASRGWLIRGDIHIVFHFDDQDRLSKYEVTEIFTGP